MANTGRSVEKATPFLRRAFRIIIGAILLSVLLAGIAIGLPAARHPAIVPGAREAPLATSPPLASGRVLAPAAPSKALPAPALAPAAPFRPLPAPAPVAPGGIAGGIALPFTGTHTGPLTAAGSALVLLGGMGLFLGRRPLRHSRGH